MYFSKIIKIYHLFGFVIQQQTRLFGMISSEIIKWNHKPVKIVAEFVEVCMHEFI